MARALEDALVLEIVDVSHRWMELASSWQGFWVALDKDQVHTLGLVLSSSS